MQRQTTVCVNPWSALRGLEPSERQSKEQTFLDLYVLAVEAEDEDEAIWAHERMRELYSEAIAGQDDRVPSFFEAMQWAAQTTSAPS
jgi:hypothetical protein